MLRHLICLTLMICWCACNPSKDNRFEVLCTKFQGKFDYAIIGGTIIDGSGKPAFNADLLTWDDSIVFIGQVDTTQIEVRVIDATHKVVTPGFIDAHAHGDPLEEEFDNFISMGVTTILLGQDGSSPVHSNLFSSTTAYFDSLERKGLLLNMAFLAGHGSLRQKAGMVTKSGLTNAELNVLTGLLEESLSAGCLGMSTGLEYLPGALADSIELVALAKKVGEHEALLMSHMRSEDDSSMNQSISELLMQGKYCDVHISHIKVVFGKDESRAEEILNSLDSARDRGIRVSADVYPYNASYTGIGIVFPPWAKTNRDFEVAKIHRNQELREYLYQKVMARNGPEATLFATRPFTGKTLAEVALESGKSFVDILLYIGPTGASGAYFVMDESIQQVFILDPGIMISSDGGPSLRHPRSSGTFSRIIEEYVINRKLMSIEEAIHKLSGLTAGTLKLPRRGVLKEGFKADILVFDPKQVRSLATYEDPFIKSEGFNTVLINGKVMKYPAKDLCDDCGELLKR